MKNGRCIGCRYFIFDINKGHYLMDESNGYGECQLIKKLVNFYSRCDKFERK